MSDTEEMQPVYMSGYSDGAKEMRVSIAAYLETEADKLMAEFSDHATTKCRAESYRIAARNIRALPLDDERWDHG